ncbi:pyridoxamine 5'-phosphate oxidase family protein [Microcella sp.]|uniref:pyridoxamine 5'-phosphate oxidase family protein n=1 Tax=Microcella sp. TaxID=1913979 RepID=UPI00391C7540
MSETLRDRLRALPAFAAELPSFDPAAAPDRADELFLQWLDDALARGVAQPHACTLSTAGPTGHVTARTLILKDLVDGQWVFAGARSTRKGIDLAANPSAALTFYWPEVGRQVRVTGEVEELPSEVAAADWAARPAVTESHNPDWAAWALTPTEVEFWQARHDRQHVRHWYRSAP